MSVGSKKCHTGHELILAFLRNPRGRSPLVEPPPPRTVSPQAKPYDGYVFAPSPQRGNPRCSFQIGEGPAFQVQSANVRLLVDRHFLGGLNLIQMLLPHNELPVMVGGVGGITPLDIPPIPPLYSQRGVMLATRKVPLLPLVVRKRRKPLRRGLPYRGASIPRRAPIGRSPLSLRRGSGPFTPSLRPRNEETPAADSKSARVQPFKARSR